MEKISIKFNSVEGNSDILQKKQNYLKRILGNDLDYKIINELNKKNNLLKRFCRKYAVLDYQLKIDYEIDENEILFYDMILNNSEIHFDSSDKIFDFYVPSDYKILDKNTNTLVMNGNSIVSGFCSYLKSKFIDIVIERVKIDDSEYPLNKKVGLNLSKINIISELDSLERFGIVESAIKHIEAEKLTDSEITEILIFFKNCLISYAKSVEMDIESLNIETIHLINLNEHKKNTDLNPNVDDETEENISNCGIIIVADESEIEDLEDKFDSEQSSNEFVEYYVIEDFLFSDEVSKF